MPTARIALRQTLQWSLRPFKVAAIPLLRSMMRKLTDRFGDEIVPLAEVNRRIEAMEAGQRRLEAFRWDHVALCRRLAALEDHVELLLHQQTSFDDSPVILQAAKNETSCDEKLVAGGRA